jgi:hypothetical protein
MASKDAEAPVDLMTEHDPLMPNIKHALFVNRVCDLPVQQKQAFIQKSYGVVLASLLVAFLVSLPFMLDQRGTSQWIGEHFWIVILAFIIASLQFLVYLAVLGALWYWGDKTLLDGYVFVLRKNWVCIAYALVYAACSGLIVAFVLSSFNIADLCFFYLYTAVHILLLFFFMYAFKRKADFMTMYGYTVPIFGLVVCTLLTYFLSHPNEITWSHLGGLAVSLIFGWILVFDTQIIFGARNEKGRKFPYEPEQSCFAGFEMYFDLWHFYLQSSKKMPGAAHYHH